MPEKLPKGWVRTTLGEVCVINPRTSFDESVSDHTEVSFVPMAAVEEESGRLDASQVRTLEAVRKGYTPFRENDVIFAKITPCMENGKIALATDLKNGLAFGSTEFFVFRPYEGVLPRFILYFLLQPKLRERAKHQMTGASGQKRVPSHYLFTHEFWLPPTREQQRIVTKLDAALSRLERAEKATRRAQGRLRRYHAAVLHAAVTGELTREWRKIQQPDETGAQFLIRLDNTRRVHWEQVELQRLRNSGKAPKDDKWKSRYPEPTALDTDDLAKIPNGWSWATLDQIAQEGRPIIYGIIKPGPHDPNGVPYVRVTEMKDGRIDVATLKKAAPARAAKFARATLAHGDVLISKDGTIGRVAIVPPELAGGNITQHVMRVPIHHLVSRDYIVWAVRSDLCQRWLNGETRGVALQGVNVADFRRLPIPIPPPSEQVEIAREIEHRLSAAAKLAATLSRQLDQARITRQSLLHEAFIGHLISQTPSEQPASALLAHIRSVREAEAKKPKGKRMSKSKSKTTRRPLLDVLREHKKPMTPEMLFRESGYEAMFNECEEPQDVVDAFYKELRKLTDKPAKVSEQKNSNHEVMLKVSP